MSKGWPPAMKTYSSSGPDTLTVTVSSTVNRKSETSGTDKPGWVYDYQMSPSSGAGRFHFSCNGTKAELEHLKGQFNDPNSEHQTHADETQAAEKWNKALKKSCDAMDDFVDGFKVIYQEDGVHIHEEQERLVSDEYTPLLAGQR